MRNKIQARARARRSREVENLITLRRYIGHYFRDLANTSGSFVIYTFNTTSMQVETREIMKKLFKNCLALIVEALTGIFCSIPEKLQVHFSSRIFGRRIDCKHSEVDQTEFPRLKSKKTVFRPQNWPKIGVFRTFVALNSNGISPKCTYY